MDRAASSGTPASENECDTRDRINVLILYDRSDAGRRAMNRLRKVNARLAEDLDLQVRLRRLEAVMDPAVATGDLATADLLVLALNNGGSLNANVRERLQEVVHQMRGQDAAVAVLANSDATTGPSRLDFLRHAAQEAGVEFLFPSANRVMAGTAPAFTDIRGRAMTMTRMPEGIMKDLPYRPRWKHRP